MHPSPSRNFVTVLFGSLGDALMAFAVFDDMLRLAPDATLTVLVRRNVELLRTLAEEYPQITICEIPRGFAALPFFAQMLAKRWTFLTLGLVSHRYSWSLRLFFIALRLTGSRTVGFHDLFLQVRLSFDLSRLMVDNLRRLIPYALPGAAAPTGAPRVHLPQTKPAGMPQEPYIMVHLFGASIAHALPPGRWRGMLTHIHATCPNVRVVLTGSPHERQKLEEIAKGLPEVEARTDFTIPELVYVIAHARLYIGIDTGVTHLAGVLQKKSIVVRHCSDPAWVPRYNPQAQVVSGSPCHIPPDADPAQCLRIKESDISYRRCLYTVSDAALFDAIDQAQK